MSGESLPEMIDLAVADLRDLGSPAIKKFPKKNEQTYMAREYESEMNIIIVKSTILMQLSLIQNIDESNDKSIIRQMYGVLKNILILYARSLHKSPAFLQDIKRYLIELARCYELNIIYCILYLIGVGNFHDLCYYHEVTYCINTLPPISAEERIIIEKTLPQFRQPSMSKKTADPFSVDELVGAKDKENKWWLARVLHRYSPANSPDYWYYIRFENCGPSHDEWICSRSYRVRHYNPKKHFLRRRR